MPVVVRILSLCHRLASGRRRRKSPSDRSRHRHTPLILRGDRALVSAFVLAGLCGCPAVSSSPEPRSSPAGRYTVVVTTSMVGDLVRHVTGEQAEVIGLMGEGVDPHLFRPTSDDVGRLMQADVILYSGLLLEGPMQPAFERAAKRGKLVHAVTGKLPREKLRFSAEFEGHPDPHVWNDVGLWAECLDQVVDVLSEFEPEHAEAYRRNADAYREELMRLDEYIREAVASIPEQRRYLVTAHDAFGYFSRAYGIEVKSVQGLTTDSDPGVQDINRLVDFLVKHEIPAIFVESTVNVANIRAVIEGAGRRGWDVKVGGMLYSDSAGPPGTYEGTYVGMIDHNVTTLARELGGSVPQRGLNGRLGQGAGPGAEE